MHTLRPASVISLRYIHTPPYFPADFFSKKKKKQQNFRIFLFPSDSLEDIVNSYGEKIANSFSLLDFFQFALLMQVLSF